jgi:tRNA (guanine-N7-)-methyltransferase
MRQGPKPYSDAPRLPEGKPLDPRTLLGTMSPVEVEIGPGRGGFIYERVAADPTVRIIGLEIRRKWATIVDRRLVALGHAPRARVFAEDARDALSRFVDQSVDKVFVHFPDPWWKKKHQKRLVISAPLLDELARVLVPGGDVFVQTDVEERAQRYEELFAAHAGFEPCAGGPRIAENPFVARSPRERRAETDGLPVFRLRYRNRGMGGAVPGPLG